MAGGYDAEGKISEWNEATFKSIRLHELQEEINALLLEPLGRVGSSFKYQLAFSLLDRLYHEGYSKYKSKERTEVDIYMDAINSILQNDPPTKIVYSNGLGGQSKTFIVDKHKLQRFLELLRTFERLIKHYNDEHGLTTSNKSKGGLF